MWCYGQGKFIARVRGRISSGAYVSRVGRCQRGATGGQKKILAAGGRAPGWIRRFRVRVAFGLGFV